MQDLIGMSLQAISLTVAAAFSRGETGEAAFGSLRCREYRWGGELGSPATRGEGTCLRRWGGGLE